MPFKSHKCTTAAAKFPYANLLLRYCGNDAVMALCNLTLCYVDTLSVPMNIQCHSLVMLLQKGEFNLSSN